MDRAHDVGGATGFGRVEVEPDEPVFHAGWERTARALVYIASMGLPHPTTSGFRDSIERMEPAHYLHSSYYERWLTSAASLAVEGGLVTREELERVAGGPFPLARPPVPAQAVAEVRATGARFDIGGRVRVRDVPPVGHSRCPLYVRGRTGVVVHVQGAFSLPDVEAHGPRRERERVYTVRFAAEELWGAGTPQGDVNVGLWDSYLEAV